MNEMKRYSDLKNMIADYMEAGFLDNIVDMYKHDSNLYMLLGDLIQDERVRVRIGVTALVEELKSSDFRNISKAVPNLVPLLKNDVPVVRGDAANLLGIIGGQLMISHLEKALSDENPDVRLIAKEAIEEIKRDQS